MESYYLVLVTKRRQIGCICGHAIYAIDESQMISVPHATIQSDVANSKTELRSVSWSFDCSLKLNYLFDFTWFFVFSFLCRYKKLLSSVDLTKDFFYSYTYPIMQSLQKNVLSSGEEGVPYDNIFVWNAYLTQPIRSRCNNTIWTLALVHGNFKQVLVCSCVLTYICLRWLLVDSKWFYWFALFRHGYRYMEETSVLL